MAKTEKSRSLRLKGALRKLTFDDLTLFESIARHESLAAAARELGLRPPFVSKALRRIEESIQFPLVRRTPQGATLTPEGAGFLKLCQSVSGAIDHADWMDPIAAGSPTEILTILGPTFLLAHLVAPFAPKPLKHLNVGLRLIDVGVEEITGGALRGHFEAAIHCDRIVWSGAWKSYPLGTASWILCARKEHPLSGRVTEGEALQFPFVLPSLSGRQGFRSGDDHCPAPVKRRVRASEVRTSEIGMQIVECTDQLIFLPEIQARARIREGKLKTIHVESWGAVRKSVHLVVHQDLVRQKLAQALLEALEKGLARVEI